MYAQERHDSWPTSANLSPYLANLADCAFEFPNGKTLKQINVWKWESSWAAVWAHCETHAGRKDRTANFAGAYARVRLFLSAMSGKAGGECLELVVISETGL